MMRRSGLLLFSFAVALGGCDRDVSAPDAGARAPGEARFSIVGPVLQVSAGQANACAIGADYRLTCWGSDHVGQSSPPADLGPVTQVDVGKGLHVCALEFDGTVACWGYNHDGQTDVPADLGRVTQVSVGGNHTCALKIDGTVACWGWEYAFGGMPADLGNVTQVSAGDHYVCALKSDGTVSCWGNPLLPFHRVTALGADSIVQISAGRHVCALKVDSTVACVIFNEFGDEYGETAVPAGLHDVTQVSAGEAHTCAVTHDGTVTCWGHEEYSRIPAGLGRVTQVSAGSAVTCFLKADGTPFCWGDITPGVVSDGGFVQVSPGGMHTCGLGADGKVSCWGGLYDEWGPVPAELDDVVQITAGHGHTCALTTTGSVTCWGRNYSGQATVPASLGQAAQVIAAEDRTCAVETDGSVVCWGSSWSWKHTCRVLTDGTVSCGSISVSQTSVPGTLGNVAQVSLGGFHTCVLHRDGTVSCWGRDHEGQASVPLGLTDVAQVSAGGFHTCALKKDGTVSCWGSNHTQADWCGFDLRCLRSVYVGQASVPSGLRNVTEVSASAYHTCALKSDGSVICWGDSYYGASTVPPGLGRATDLAGNAMTTCVVLFDTTVECWGAQKTFAVNTPAGDNVQVKPVDQATGSSSAVLLTFANVTSPGTTSVTSGTASGSAPEGFRVISPSHVFDLETTATFTGEVTVCVDYTGADFADESSIRLLHGDAGGNWTDVTTSHDAENNVICGTVTSFSPFLLAEENAAPVVTSIVLPVDAVAVNTPASLRAVFSDANAADLHSATIDWEGAAEPAAVDQAGNSIAGSHSYTQPGIYPVQVNVSDGDRAGNRSSVLDDPAYIVVYDPSAGFITGGGWFESPVNACSTLCGGRTGRATFDFELRYRRQATTPSGNFKFALGALRFTSTSYRWLVVSAGRAEAKGEGTINDGGSYGFLLTAIDGKSDGSGGADRLRIRIWDRSRSASDPDYLIYDNQLGTAESSGAATALGGGSIVIHDK